MEHINAFGHSIIKFHCNNKELYQDPSLSKSVDRIFSLPEISQRERGADWDSQYGPGETTEICPWLGPANIPDAQPLVRWILEQIQNYYGKRFTVSKSWMNSMGPGSQGLCHTHTGGADLVAIFYIQNAASSSDLIIIDQGRPGTKFAEYELAARLHIKVGDGDLIIHDPDVWHAVGINDSDQQRICFVFHLCADEAK